MPAECSPQKSLIMLEIRLPAEFIQACLDFSCNLVFIYFPYAKKKIQKLCVTTIQPTSPTITKQKKITFTCTIKVTVLHTKGKKTLRTQSLLLNNLLLTEREGRIGEYWPSVVAVRTERSEVRTKTTEGQYSPVRSRASEVSK